MNLQAIDYQSIAHYYFTHFLILSIKKALRRVLQGFFYAICFTHCQHLPQTNCTLTIQT
jgi:hypothetical protein